MKKMKEIKIEKMKKCGFTRKILDDFQGLPLLLLLLFFNQNPRRFLWFCFGMCLFPKENQQLILGGHRFSIEKWQCSLDVKQKYIFYFLESTKNNR